MNSYPVERRGLLTVLNCGALVIHVTSGALGVVLLRHGNPDVHAVAPLFEYYTSSKSGELFKAKPKTIFHVGSLDSLVAVVWITAIFHVLYLVQLYSPWFCGFLRDVLGGGGVNPLRWVEYAMTSTIMAAFGNLNIGITDFYLFLKVLCTGVALQMIGFVLELLDHKDALHARVAGILWNQATLLNLVNIFIILFQVFASSTHTTIFYWNVIPYSIYFNTFGIVSWLSFKRSGPFASASYTEAWYIALSLSTKFAVFFLGFATYRGLEEDRGFADKTPGVDWNVVRLMASYLPSGILVCVAVWQYITNRGVKVEIKAIDAGKKNDDLQTNKAMRLVM